MRLDGNKIDGSNQGNRFNASMPSPKWQGLRSVAMMNTFCLGACASFAVINR
jgi:hypothetical protein